MMPSFETEPRTRRRAEFVPMPFGAERRTASPEIGDFEPDGVPKPIPASADRDSKALEEMDAELRKAREEGCAAGYAQGLEEGRTAGRAEAQSAELGSACEALEEVARGLSGTRRGYLRSQRRAIVDLAVSIAEKLLARAVEADPDALAGVVERALGVLEEPRKSEVHLSPADLELIERGLSPRIEAAVEEGGAVLVADESLAPGDVRILAGTTEVDARRAELLRRVREELLELVDLEETES